MNIKLYGGRVAEGEGKQEVTVDSSDVSTSISIWVTL